MWGIWGWHFMKNLYGFQKSGENSTEIINLNLKTIKVR